MTSSTTDFSKYLNCVDLVIGKVEKLKRNGCCSDDKKVIVPDNTMGGSTRLEMPTPPDGGWGWMVVFASFMIHVILDGVTYSSGLLYVEWLQEFEGGKGVTSWITSVLVFFTIGGGPLSSIIVKKTSLRIASMIGAGIAAFGCIISIFAPNVIFLCISFGVVTGIGFGIMYLPAIVAVTYYFEKRRSFATGLAVCGSGVGTFTFSPLCTYLISLYGWKGTMLIEAALILNCIAFGALFRPLRKEKQFNQKLRHTSSQAFRKVSYAVRSRKMITSFQFYQSPTVISRPFFYILPYICHINVFHRT